MHEGKDSGQKLMNMSHPGVRSPLLHVLWAGADACLSSVWDWGALWSALLWSHRRAVRRPGVTAGHRGGRWHNRR